MASKLEDRTHEKKPWRARVKMDGWDFFLGYFATKEEAAAEENRFRRAMGKKERDGFVVIGSRTWRKRENEQAAAKEDGEGSREGSTQRGRENGH